MDSLSALRAAYFVLLSDLQDNGVSVPIYPDMAPDDAVAPYVIMTTGTTGEDNTKDTLGNEAALTLDIVTRFVGNARSWVPASRIATEILNRLKPDTGTIGLQPQGYTLWRVKVDGREISLITRTETLYRKLLTITHALTTA